MPTQSKSAAGADFLLLQRLILLILTAVLPVGCFYSETPVGPDNSKIPIVTQPGKSGKDRNSVRVLGTVPGFSLTDQTGKPFGMAELRGKVWIANFFFTQCTATCPKQTAQMARLQKQFENDERWDDIRLLGISIDPDNDSPEVLRKYARQAGADEEHWKFLTGTRETVWSLSKEGFKLAVGEAPDSVDMPLFHSSKFALVDALGRIRGYFDGQTKKGLDELTDSLNLVFEERKAVPQEIDGH